MNKAYIIPHLQAISSHLYKLELELILISFYLSHQVSVFYPQNIFCYILSCSWCCSLYACCDALVSSFVARIFLKMLPPFHLIRIHIHLI